MLLEDVLQTNDVDPFGLDVLTFEFDEVEPAGRADFVGVVEVVFDELLQELGLRRWPVPLLLRLGLLRRRTPRTSFTAGAVARIAITTNAAERALPAAVLGRKTRSAHTRSAAWRSRRFSTHISGAESSTAFPRRGYPPRRHRAPPRRPNRPSASRNGMIAASAERAYWDLGQRALGRARTADRAFGNSALLMGAAVAHEALRTAWKESRSGGAGGLTQTSVRYPITTDVRPRCGCAGSFRRARARMVSRLSIPSRPDARSSVFSTSDPKLPERDRWLGSRCRRGGPWDRSGDDLIARCSSTASVPVEAGTPTVIAPAA
jgi:hypothetical protein